METTLAERAPSPTPKLAPEVPAIRVLLIEDNPMDVRLIGIMLRDSAPSVFEIEQVDRLEAGLQQLAGGRYDLVLVDLSLPDSHGLETFSRVYAQAPKVPIIVLSGLADETVAVAAVHEGAQDYLVKGQVSGPLLVRAMRYAIERKRTSEQLGRYAEELREKNVQMEADFNMAREIQQMFLPQRYPTFPRAADHATSALKFYHRYLPAAAVGGDFFNVFPITNTICGIFICDVMGHGMRAALVTAILRGLVEELIAVAMDAGKFLGEINRSLHAILRRTTEPLLATAFYGIADVTDGTLQWACAGHPSPLRLRRSRGVVEPLKLYDPRHGPALGLFEQAQYPICQCPLEVNDVLLLFTDGLFEINGETQEEFGQERLLAAVQRRIEVPPDKLFDEILAEVREYAGDEFIDDVCLVAAEVTRFEGRRRAS
ncbi:MAG TPA: fused response regulator/phosphatase [Verrucomicrobiae bacterium]|nr:fused response regulator/phosphatase [Verrucomicrobiae bacterium]